MLLQMGSICCKEAKDSSHNDAVKYSETDHCEIQCAQPVMSVVADTNRVVPYMTKKKDRRDSIIVLSPYSRPNH